jgi:hypothetical protein
VPTTRKPEVIVREIEQTRAELADTIDAITERINPRRAASRGARAVREQVSGLRDRVSPDGSEAADEAGGHAAGGVVPGGVRPALIAVAAIVAVFGLMLVRKRR